MEIKINTKNFIKKNFSILIFLLSFLSLFISFYLDEDGTGKGASGDFEATYGFILALKDNILANPKEYTLVHTPLHFILMSIFDSFFNNKTFLRLFYCLITILLPLFFYFSLKKIHTKNKQNLLILASIIFILPAFRYTSIWATDLITSLIFFQISIFFYWKWNLNKSTTINKDIFFQIIFLALATYCRQYFAVFFVYFLIIYIKELEFKSFINLFLIFFFKSVPVFYYTFLFPALILEQHISLNSIKFFLLGNSSMMSIYLLPIFLINLIYRKLIFNKETIISLVLSFFIITILIYLFKPVSHWLGGGVVYQLSIKLFGNNYLFYLSSFYFFHVY